MAIFDRAINSYDTHRTEMEVRHREHEIAEGKRLAEKVSTLLGQPIEPNGTKLVVRDEGRTVTFFFSTEIEHSGEKLMAEMPCMRCLERSVAEVNGPVDLGRLIVEGFHEGKCMPARVDDTRRAPGR